MLSAIDPLIKGGQTAMRAKILQSTELQGPGIRVDFLMALKYKPSVPGMWLKGFG